jgi:8-oxo-dGTP diphosphatase
VIVVVAAALVRDGRLLAARRTTPPEAAGRWELPGGKVEPGESADRAVVREVAEELGCEAAIEHWLAGGEPIGDIGLLRVAVCRVVTGEPAAGSDHDELRWLAADELDEVDWLEPDRPFLPAVTEVLLGSEV